MKKNLIIILVFSVFCFTYCNPTKRQEITGKELMEVDSTFSALSKEKGTQYAFLQYLDDDAVMLKEDSYPVKGKNDIKEILDKMPDSSELTWKPCFANVAFSGDMGYTYGTYQFIEKEDTVYGTYLSVWKKVMGEWKLVLDTGNEGLDE